MPLMDIEEKILKDKVRHLYGQNPSALAANMAIGLLVFFFFHSTGGSFFTYWLLALAGLTAVRGGVLWAFIRHEAGLSSRAWLGIYILFTGLAGALLGGLELTHFYV